MRANGSLTGFAGGPLARLIDIRPGEGQALVSTLVCGICGSDLSYIKMGGIPLPGTKTALGHEASGEVIEVGSDVTGHAVGERVVINGMFVGSGGMEGAFTPELVLKDAEAMGKLLPIPEGVPYEIAALCEPLADALHRDGEALALVRLEHIVDRALLEGLDRVLVVGGDEDDVRAPRR